MLKKTAAQVPFAKKAAATKAANRKPAGKPAAVRDRNRKYQIKAALADADAKKKIGKARNAHNGDADDDAAKVDLASVQERLAHRVGLLDKHEITAITGVTFPTIWAWMRGGTFPRAHIVVGKSMWHAAEVADWLAKLPVRPLKGDAVDEQTTEASAA
jgi:predicted DNA-binding transcriptional regulator AlpA